MSQPSSGQMQSGHRKADEGQTPAASGGSTAPCTHTFGAEPHGVGRSPLQLLDVRAHAVLTAETRLAPWMSGLTLAPDRWAITGCLQISWELACSGLQSGRPRSSTAVRRCSVQTADGSLLNSGAVSKPGFSAGTTAPYHTSAVPDPTRRITAWACWKYPHVGE
jgi:hypothetical protein